MNDVTPFETKTSKLGIDASETDEGTPVPQVEASIFSVRPDTGSQPKLVWPPLKEDLERLYLEKKLSAMKIAKVYGLKYKNDKTAESTILYHLKRHGITRRDAAAHVRKATDAMVDEWVKRYQNGESLKQIAGDLMTPTSVWHRLRKRGVKLRDKVEAQIEAVQKHEKTPFSGDKHEMAYIVAMAIGDYAAQRHGRAIRVKTSTTHPAMTRVYRDLFEQHGPIYEYPREAQLSGFEWSLDCDLDKSFEFLLDMRKLASLMIADHEVFLDFLAGFFDAEGSIYYHRKHRTGGAFELKIANTNEMLLREITAKLNPLGVSWTLRRQRLDRQKLLERGMKNPGEFIWALEIWRHKSVNRLLKLMPLRHQEKVKKAGIAQRLESWPTLNHRLQVLSEWQALLDAIDSEVEKYVARAKEVWEIKRSPSPFLREEDDSTAPTVSDN